MTSFKALRVEEQTDGSFLRSIQHRTIEELPEGEVLVRVYYSALNYKDALSATGHKGITRTFPHTPGIDAAGIVEASSSPDWQAGDKVIVTSYDLGMNTDGGFSEYIRVPANWVVKLPESLDFRQAMILGTAGFTAGLALYKMELCGQNPGMGPILITGASGGLGSMAVAIFSEAFYEVIASTGKIDKHDYLRKLGANICVDREFANDTSNRPLLKSRWAGAVDTVGGNTLITCMKSCKRNGSVAVTGLVDRPDFEATVYPFILNGINLLGVESAETPMSIRKHIWEKLAGAWRPKHLEMIAQAEVSLEELNDKYIDLILKGQTTGRILVKL